MHKSYWLDSAGFPTFKKIDGDIKTDVLIIGGGISGILCAHFLKEAGIDCIIAEKDRIAHGTTGNTTAKITSQHGLVYDYLTSNFGKENARKYLDINETAIEKYEELCKGADCDFKKTSAFTYSADDLKKIENEVKARNSLGASAQLVQSLPLPFKVAGAVGVENQAEFNPIKFIKKISKNLSIYENSMVKELTPEGAICDGGRIRAESIIVATHFPFLNTHGSFFLKLYQHRSYVLALENAQDMNGMYADEKEGGLSFRKSGNLLLLGGCGNRTGKKCGGWSGLEDFKNKYYPKSVIKYKWATQDCMSLDRLPYIGKYSKHTPNLYVATGFNKWGMTSAMVSAMILTDLIQGKKNDYADLFSPSRSILRPQLIANGVETISNMISPTVKRCPHLGCALKWNKAEHSWDCSCHGSRFDEKGKLLNNPAMKDADV